MSVKTGEDDALSSRSPGEIDSPRSKKMRLENSMRKGWSLMDRRTDQEVLQEMGVSLLEPDDAEAHHDTSLHNKPSLKRKHNQENINPNKKSSPNKSPSSPKTRLSPGPGPSKVKSPRSADKSKPLQPTENILETTLVSDYQIDEETPLGQSVSATYLPVAQSGSAKKHKGSVTPLGREEELIISRRLQSSPTGTDSFSALSDEMLLSVFRWLPKRALAHCMLVCKRWHRVACDETLWQRLDLGNKTLAKDALARILARKPVIVRLANSEVCTF
ncbi:lysine-specific demethylase 2A-like [Hyposmocoma kahamanoa]|uniref:lysine-specific demethylase 2A-like n=1 Tax=Hyposmocoma kahamanoa TaxID=1477025 RepID=UPI000E6D90BC|nr:lysine-specific demethylase 2A-like [Hyposmocoma kahamanoa]